jgi:hypothetical protein
MTRVFTPKELEEAGCSWVAGSGKARRTRPVPSVRRTCSASIWARWAQLAQEAEINLEDPPEVKS